MPGGGSADARATGRGPTAAYLDAHPIAPAASGVIAACPPRGGQARFVSRKSRPLQHPADVQWRLHATACFEGRWPSGGVAREKLHEHARNLARLVAFSLQISARGAAIASRKPAGVSGPLEHSADVQWRLHAAACFEGR